MKKDLGKDGDVLNFLHQGVFELLYPFHQSRLVEGSDLVCFSFGILGKRSSSLWQKDPWNLSRGSLFKCPFKLFAASVLQQKWFVPVYQDYYWRILWLYSSWRSLQVEEIHEKKADGLEGALCG